MKDLSREEYIREIYYCYENSRWEFSFYAVLYMYLLQFRNEETKLVLCADWKSRGKRTSEVMKKILEFCSVIYKGKDDKDYIGGIPDFQFVPSEYKFEDPCKAIVFIEFKSPKFSDKNEYIPLIYRETTEIKHEFEKCNKIIFTDGLSWYFLEKHRRAQEVPINLIDDNDNWDRLKIEIIKFINEN